MKFKASYWIKYSLINLFIVATLGVIMRYKIGFEFPYLNQKYIQHAHSHFAFLGWITHSIYVLIIYFITEKVAQNNLRQYHKLLIINLICSYCILISFFVSGYSIVSICLSTLSILINCFFAYYLFNDFKKLETYHPSVAWFKSAIWFNLASSAGTFYLAYMMASRNFNENWYLAAVYFYLHFQYNGFFTFSIFGFAVNKLTKYLPEYKYDKQIFILFFTSCIPAYLLSTLWVKIPGWLYFIVVIAALVQLIAWIKFVWDIHKSLKGENLFSGFARFMFIFVGFAFSIKILLQLGSTIPELSKLAFGFRPVVIAYLHLVLLAVISAFLLAYFYTTELIQTHKKTVIALSVFLAGIFLNELALAIQGIAAFNYLPIKFINEILFFISLILVSGAILIVASQIKRKLTE